MPISPYFFRPEYYEYWNSIVTFYSGTNQWIPQVRNYVRSAIADSIPSDSSDACSLAGGFVKKIEIRDIRSHGLYLDNSSWINVCLPLEYSSVPDVIYIDPHNGLLTADKYGEVGVLHSFWLTMVGTWHSDVFTTVLAFIFGDMMKPGGMLEWLGNASTWLSNISKKYTESWFLKVETFVNNIDKTIRNITNPLTLTIQSVLTSINDYIWPTLHNVKDLLTTVNTTVTDLQKTQKTIQETLTGPYKTIEKTILYTYSLETREFLKTIDPVVKLLGLFGYKEAQEFEDGIKVTLDDIGKYIEVPGTALRRFELKVQRQLDTFILDVYTPVYAEVSRIIPLVDALGAFTDETVKPDLAHLTPLVDAVIELQEGQEAENARLRRTALYNSLSAYPATSLSGLNARLPRQTITSWTPVALQEVKLPEAEYWLYQLNGMGKNLYVDDDGKAIAPVVGTDGKLTTDRRYVPGRTVNIADALRVEPTNWQDELETRILLYEYGLKTSQIANFYLSFDALQRVAEFSLDKFDKTVFYTGYWGARFLAYWSGMNFDLHTPAEMQEEAAIFEQWIIQEIKETLDWISEMNRSSGQVFYMGMR